jgi:hypothetical protein
MGIEHYLVCGECKQYIDLHKAYGFYTTCNSTTPPIGVDCGENGFNDSRLSGGYWDGRGLWFLWKHRGHNGIDIRTDTEDKWYDDEPYLKEVFPHSEDLKIRERIKNYKETP